MAGRDDPEIRQEARFTLWALRTFNLRQLAGDQRQALLAHGFDLADARHALPEFLRFGLRLEGAAGRRIHWHEPHCCRLSVGELRVLQALAQCQCAGECPAWRALLGEGESGQLVASGRQWLVALSLEGICFPTPAELVQGLAPLENLISFQAECG